MAIPNAAVYDSWFATADGDRDGRVTGADAVQFFDRSGLPRDVLARVWDLANSSRAGYLDRGSFGKAMELISLAQSGQLVSKENHMHAIMDGIKPPRMAGLNDQDVANGGDASSNPYDNYNPYWAAESPAATTAANNTSRSRTPSRGEYGGGGGAMPSELPTVLPTSNSYPPMEQLHVSKGGGFKLSKANQKRPVPGKVCTSIIDGLKLIYFKKIRPLEDMFKFGSFFSPLLHESDFEAKPSVLLLGQYSTGKTTFIKHLLGTAYPGCHIGPEPTTDRFVVVNHGLEERRIPGNTLAVQPDQPYQGLSIFGTGFLSRFEGAVCSAKLLEEISLVDTPGVLSGEKQRIERNYNFTDICSWFASRADLILLLFDPHKLDISDEFKSVINTLRGHDDKVRIVLNKADQVDQQQLMRVYGALMWSLGKVFKSPEVCRVYIGSFNSEAPISTDKNPHGKALFEAEQANLFHDLYEIPQRSCDRKVNEFVKRVRAAKIHILLVGHLRKQMPTMFGKDKMQKKLLDGLVDHFRQVQREHHLPPGDFPDVNRFKDILSAFDFANDFPKVTKAMVKQIEDVLSIDIPNLLKAFDNPYG